MKSLVMMLLCLALTMPAVAGEVYIPFLAADDPPDDSGRSTVPSVEVYNLGGVARRYTVRVVGAGEDGGAGGELVATAVLAPGATAVVPCCTRASGLLVVSGAPQIAAGGRLALTFTGGPAPNVLVARLPALTLRDALRPGTTAVLQTLQGTQSGSRRSSLGILNLGTAEATCAVKLGIFEDRFPELFELTVPPRSLAAFPDVFSRLRGVHAPVFIDVRTLVVCDRPFYPFAVNFVGDFDVVSGLPWVELVPPSVQLANAL